MYNNYDPNNVAYHDAYKQAEQRVQAKMGFYGHLTAYILVNGLLIAIYLFTTAGGYPWFIWPMLGWGIGLAFHFAGVFGFGSSNSAEVRRRMIEEEMRRMGVRPGTSYATPTSNAFPPVTPDTRVSGNSVPGETPPDYR